MSSPSVVSIASLREALVEQVAAAGDPTTAKGQANYHKTLHHFYGVRAPQLQQLFKRFYADQLRELPIETCFQLSVALLSEAHSECKQCAALLLQAVLPQLNAEHLHRLEAVLDEHCFDWATCDALSCRVFFVLVQREPSCLAIVQSWKDAPNLWRQRASCVTFVKLGKRPEYVETIFDICATTCLNPERFVQLGTGWVLRQVSLIELDRVVAFLKKNYAHFSREGLRYAIEKMDPGLRKQLLRYGRDPPPNKRLRN